MDESPPPAAAASADDDGALAGPPLDAGAAPRAALAHDDPDARHPDDLPPQRTGLRIPRGLLWALALAVVVLVIASWVALANDGSSPSSTAAGSDGVVRLGNGSPTLVGGPSGDALVGKPAPAFTWRSFSGAPASSTDLAGAPLVVNFWRSDCAPCVTEMPALQKVRDAMGEKVAFLGLATTESNEDAARKLAERTGVKYALGFDPKGEAGSAFGIIGLPTTVLIDRTGKVVYVHLGEIAGDELTKQINEKLLAP